MSTTDDFPEYISNLHPLLDLVGLIVEDVRQRVACTFRHAEQAAKIPADVDITEGLHWEMAERFGAAAFHLKENDLEIGPLYL